MLTMVEFSEQFAPFLVGEWLTGFLTAKPKKARPSRQVATHLTTEWTSAATADKDFVFENEINSFMWWYAADGVADELAFPLANRTDLPEHERAISALAWRMVQDGLRSAREGKTRVLERSRFRDD